MIYQRLGVPFDLLDYPCTVFVKFVFIWSFLPIQILCFIFSIKVIETLLCKRDKLRNWNLFVFLPDFILFEFVLMPSTKTPLTALFERSCPTIWNKRIGFLVFFTCKFSTIIANAMVINDLFNRPILFESSGVNHLRCSKLY